MLQIRSYKLTRSTYIQCRLGFLEILSEEKTTKNTNKSASHANNKELGEIRMITDLEEEKQVAENLRQVHRNLQQMKIDSNIRSELLDDQKVQLKKIGEKMGKTNEKVVNQNHQMDKILKQ